MSETVVWALIGVFTTIMLGGMTLMTTLINRATTAAIGGLRGEIGGELGGLRAEMRAEISGLRAEMNARFDTVDVRIQHLDRDVAALTRRVWGETPGE